MYPILSRRLFKHFKPAPWLVLILIYIVTVALWFGAKGWFFGYISSAPLFAARQLTALLGAVSLGIQFFLVTKTRFLERWMGGLDKVYRYHHLLGLIAYTLLALHPAFLLASLNFDIELLKPYLFPFQNIEYTFGMLALDLMTFLIVLTFLKIPYHIWKLTHQLMGLVILLGALHIYLVPSDVSYFTPLRVWVLGFIILGILSYLYAVLLFRFLAPKGSYEVAQTDVRGQITELKLRPTGKPLEHRAGQFMFVQFEKSNAATRERHPFSISSKPGEELLRLSIKNSGDYTSRLKDVKAGDQLSLYGPYGVFGDKLYTSSKEMVWIAGGIGITPFLSMAGYHIANQLSMGVDLLYCYRDPEEALYLDELREYEQKSGGKIEIHNWCSSVDGRIDIAQIKKLVGDLDQKLFFICGPTEMMHQLIEQLQAEGIPPRNIVYEDFSLR